MYTLTIWQEATDDDVAGIGFAGIGLTILERYVQRDSDDVRNSKKGNSTSDINDRKRASGTATYYVGERMEMASGTTGSQQWPSSFFADAMASMFFPANICFSASLPPKRYVHS